MIDIDSRFTLPGANIILLDSEPINGASTDNNGKFILQDVPVGRRSLRVSYTGYETIDLNDLIVSTGKELVLIIELKESVTSVGEVEIVAEHRKDQPINPMALVSARSFTIEETNKYAGSYGDPARMAANYAGVASSRDNRNDIVIRGNSPIGLQYRLNGIEITNPNHFGALGTTGGPITMLNTNLLTNSDFLTGAFPAEYGNAISGVFDINMRTGNSDQREYWAQIGWNGLEFGLEGPFSKKSSASYLAAYRYSLTDIIEKLGVKLQESAQYQDLSFNLSFPTKNAGVFNLFGMGGISAIQKLDSGKNADDWTFATHGEDIRSASRLASVGFSHFYFFDKNTSLQTRLSFVGADIESNIDTMSIQNQAPFLVAGEKSSEIKYAVSTVLSKKINAANIFDFGGSWNAYNVSYADSQYIHNEYIHFTDSKAFYSLWQAYAQWQHKFGKGITANLGLHYQFLTLNKSQYLEPRFGLKWDINPGNTFSFGVGLHSQMQPGMMYFVQSQFSDGSYALTNEQMDFSKSLQFVLGYDHLFSEFFRIKAETYYQYLYDIPVKQSIPQYSLLNEGTEFFVDRMDSLVNKGTGENYGLELTLEKFMGRNYFFLFTASLFQSKYQGYDGVTRSTSFNSNYIFNAVGGYELPFGKRKNRVLILGLRATLAGGRPFIPYDQEATVEAGHVVYDWENAYVPRYDDYFRASFRIGMRRNERKFNVAFFFDLQYRANYTYIFMYRIDVVTGELVKDFNMGFYPNSTVRIQF